MTFQGWGDEPISDRNDDTLNRADYAARLAELVATTHASDSSTVFGLTGQWGSGKTSMIHLIVKELLAIDSAYRVVWFTPWAAHDVSGLLADFYTTLLAALPKHVAKKAKKSFATMLRIAAPAGALVPLGGAVATSAINAAADALRREKPWNEAFQDASAQIIEAKTRILIVVDDIDRLQSDELLGVMKVIRLLGRFPGVQYLLAYDHDSLTRTLQAAGAAQGPADASQYIEKIVQYPIPVPALVGVQLVNRLTTGLNKVIARRRPDLGEMRLHRTSDLLPVMRNVLTTPRAIDRYLAQLDNELGLHYWNEIDDEDLITLTLLRTTIPALYAKLPQYEYELVNGHIPDRFLGLTPNKEAAQFDIETLTEDLKLTTVESNAATEILYALFPKIRSSNGVIRRHGVSNGNYFRRYFAMGILRDHDVPDYKVLSALRSTFNGDGGALISLITAEDAALGELAFMKIQEIYEQELRQIPATDIDASVLSLMNALSSIINDPPDSEALFWGLSDQVPRWIGHRLVPSLSDSTGVSSLLSALPTVIRARLTILRLARSRIDGRPAWWKPVHSALSDAAQRDFLDHLRARDSASESREDLIHFFMNAAGAGVDLEPVRVAITTAIDDGEFTIADLAARFVDMEVSGSTFSCRQTEFDMLAPRCEYPWYSETEPFPTQGNWSWPDRRAVATNLVKPPPSTGD